MRITEIVISNDGIRLSSSSRAFLFFINTNNSIEIKKRSIKRISMREFVN